MFIMQFEYIQKKKHLGQQINWQLAPETKRRKIILYFVKLP